MAKSNIIILNQNLVKYYSQEFMEHLRSEKISLQNECQFLSLAHDRVFRGSHETKGYRR